MTNAKSHVREAGKVPCDHGTRDYARFTPQQLACPEGPAGRSVLEGREDENGGRRRELAGRNGGAGFRLDRGSDRPGIGTRTAQGKGTAAREVAAGLDWTDLFSGGGGTSEGLCRAGHRVVICANHWPVAVATHQANHPDVEHIIANLSETDFRRFPRTAALWLSPSCVWHARSGGRTRPPAEVERLRADQGSIDRATAFAAVAAAEVHRYEVIVVENVVEFTAWSLFDWWLDGLRSLGYRYQSAVINATEVPDAVPQHRPRWFGIFTRVGGVDLSLPPVQAPVASSILEPDLGTPVTRRLYVSPQIAEITETGVAHLVTYRRNARARRADRHPLATVTAGGNHHAVASIGEDGTAFHRMLTNTERARAMGFPDSYQWHGKTAAEVRRQIGNAVAVPVAAFLAERIAARLEVA
ncbi:DNA cytosine methyltransferase [Nocardia sp. NPDC050713]|uniref:DNA cytosine methyltransferase n=1 Tax=Nocardia sp. NPDC050713 TaxID=3154511 RepID=UPI0033D1E7EA